MTRVDFYFNAADKLQVACRLAGKALAQGKRLLVYAPQPDTAQGIDRMLWTAQAVSFLPHCAALDPLAAETPAELRGKFVYPQDAGGAFAASGKIDTKLLDKLPGWKRAFSDKFSVIHQRTPASSS